MSVLETWLGNFFSKAETSCLLCGWLPLYLGDDCRLSPFPRILLFSYGFHNAYALFHLPGDHMLTPRHSVLTTKKQNRKLSVFASAFSMDKILQPVCFSMKFSSSHFSQLIRLQSVWNCEATNLVHEAWNNSVLKGTLTFTYFSTDYNMKIFSCL